MTTAFQESLLLEHPNLGPESVVFDVGSYEGWWAGEINTKYGCTVHAFEPISEFYHEMVIRLQGRDKIKTVHGALWPDAGETSFGKKGAMSGPYCGDPNAMEAVKTIALQPYLDANNIRVINLLALNCEGSEFPLLEYMLRVGLVKNCDRIIVQPHGVVPGAQERWARIRRRIMNTHHLLFSSPWVWEGYEIQPEVKKERERFYQ